MAKKGKVGTGGREIMAALWGSRGRPETNQYAELCASRQCGDEPRNLEVTEVVTPKPIEAPRTTEKWAKARKANGIA